METITTIHDGKIVKHVAAEISIEQKVTATPFEYPSWVPGAKCDGKTDEYFYHDKKTTLEAKVYTEHKDAFMCGFELTYDGSPYVIESVETHSKSPYVTVIASAR
jgi:hypothetical protein